jgi:hypothetical protein
MATANAITGVAGGHVVYGVDLSNPPNYDKNWCETGAYGRVGGLPVQFKPVLLARLLSVGSYDFLARKIMEGGGMPHDDVMVGHAHRRCIIMRHRGREYVQIGHRYLVRKTIEESV